MVVKKRKIESLVGSLKVPSKNISSIKKELSSVPSPPKKIIISSVPSPIRSLPSFPELENNPKVRKSSLKITPAVEKSEENVSFIGAIKNKLFSGKLTPKKTETKTSFDFLEAEHALFKPKDYYRLQQKKIFPKISKKDVIGKSSLRILEDGPIFKHDEEVSFPELSFFKKAQEMPVKDSSIKKKALPNIDFSDFVFQEPETIVPIKSSLEILSQMDPMEKSMELIEKCQRALQKRNYDFAVIYSEELVPFYKRLGVRQQEDLREYVEDMHQKIQMLYLDKVHDRLKKAR